MNISNVYANTEAYNKFVIPGTAELVYGTAEILTRPAEIIAGTAEEYRETVNISRDAWALVSKHFNSYNNVSIIAYREDLKNYYEEWRKQNPNTVEMEVKGVNAFVNKDYTRVTFKAFIINGNRKTPVSASFGIKGREREKGKTEKTKRFLPKVRTFVFSYVNYTDVKREVDIKGESIILECDFTNSEINVYR